MANPWRNGIHTHFCQRCDADKECPIITHCKWPAEHPCLDCRAAEFILGKTEEAYYETGKWPKE